MWSALGLLFAAVPLIAWAMVARTRQAGPVVGVALLACAGLLVAVQHGWVSASRADAHAVYVPVTGLLIGFGVLLERHQEGPGQGRWVHRRSGAVGLLVAQLALTLCGCALYVLMLAEPSEPPSARDVPKLPPGLTVVSQNSGCGTSNCYRTLVIGSTTGLSPDGIVHALGRPHETCRPNGWLLDRRDLCIGVTASDERVVLYVALNGLFD
ncbi:hypothetical protein GCM10010193_47100 [Kitasatospora atroaurantiaca]|uniref:Uncharacterized protein n=1 Tax=Kitasatospora atroaurantiaca TaxID=285545 RepID=A0A561EZ71_9ACTN|nr:MFS transporter [Kitasatospora atroaurantiaca]TWE20909.1 hypothetical protein FB465_6069 [Kitasatospora atroaurantiaca]